MRLNLATGGEHERPREHVGAHQANVERERTRSNATGAEDTLLFDLTQGSTTIRYPVTLSAEP